MSNRDAIVLDLEAWLGRLQFYWSEVPENEACCKEHFGETIKRWQHVRDAQRISRPNMPSLKHTAATAAYGSEFVAAAVVQRVVNRRSAFGGQCSLVFVCLQVICQFSVFRVLT